MQTQMGTPSKNCRDYSIRLYTRVDFGCLSGIKLLLSLLMLRTSAAQGLRRTSATCFGPVEKVPSTVTAVKGQECPKLRDMHVFECKMDLTEQSSEAGNTLLLKVKRLPTDEEIDMEFKIEET